MPLVKSAATKLEWAKVMTQLKLTGRTASELSSFKKRNEEARRKLLELQTKSTEVDFDFYRSALKNKQIVDQIQKSFQQYKPVKINTSEQLSTIAEFEKQALQSAKETEQVVARELADLSATLKNIEAARPFDQLTVDELVKAKPEIDAKVEEMVKKGKWDVPGYKEKFGDLTVM
ncbi:hypothetical protein TBLA_0C00950 [Henningerozyma blattae CBS 6284]|uniref:ATP synthase subunit d, mitochondrial n=1 Tax=Henningerozyma blattae (strain ATCC 34711 / CBS 6284 / DSM 70876 / NBRC 10599 / NRRL Y-10934 / UCD 77-7) TaxID=1071380 RepID=I2H0K8_HENB6|nr:hypothetical protein TBLA_0C00950 [Tetrapisispora blattae CBS 6284]CCH59910.1 hypothetical protein TBLA_0C00950 [Tetrapisispora blattae CBS 6284]